MGAWGRVGRRRPTRDETRKGRHGVRPADVRPDLRAGPPSPVSGRLPGRARSEPGPLLMSAGRGPRLTTGLRSEGRAIRVADARPAGASASGPTRPTWPGRRHRRPGPPGRDRARPAGLAVRQSRERGQCGGSVWGGGDVDASCVMKLFPAGIPPAGCRPGITCRGGGDVDAAGVGFRNIDFQISIFGWKIEIRKSESRGGRWARGRFCSHRTHKKSPPPGSGPGRLRAGL